MHQGPQATHFTLAIHDNAKFGKDIRKKIFSFVGMP